MSTDKIQHVSDTAIWVATYRARESARKDAVFQDPLAKILIGDRGEKIAKSLRAYERYVNWVVIARTSLIDRFILQLADQGFKTFINLGTGLDTRPYRLNLPADVHWIEVDFPHVIEHKNLKLKNEIPKCKLERIAADLSNSEMRKKILNDLNTRISPAVVLTEGVVPYLTEETVTELANDLHATSQIKRWIGEYYSPLVYLRLKSPSFQKRLGNAPFQFFPQDWFGLFEKAGWKKSEIGYLYDEGQRIGRKFPLPFPFSILMRFAQPQKIAKKLRLQAFVIYERKE